MRHLLVLALALLLAAPAIAGECHVPVVVPLVTNWSITAKPGGLVIDADIAPQFPHISLAYYYNQVSDDDPSRWYHFLGLRPAGATGFYVALDLQHATVTDSTFHFDAPYPAGAYEYHASIGGYGGDPQECGDAYEWRGTITIVDPTPARRSSLGEIMRRWRP